LIQKSVGNNRADKIGVDKMNRIKRDCGCETQHNGDGNWFIEFCPLHATAPELLEACKEALQIMEAKWPNSTIINKIERAIKYATRL